MSESGKTGIQVRNYPRDTSGEPQSGDAKLIGVFYFCPTNSSLIFLFPCQYPHKSRDKAGQPH